MTTDLPIDEALPALRDALRAGNGAVLHAPPGAGKTTRVPLALLPEPWVKGRILMLEPRRVAARAAAERMAETLGERTGETIGYRIRGKSKVSARTRVEVVTEGILTRRLQSDPGLEDIACVIFDEFHERSIHADLGLALCLESQGALREDLRLLVMSATLDAAPVAAIMNNAPVISSPGRAFPVETRWLAAPPRERLAEGVAELALHALSEQAGDALVFLPGAGEIGRVEGLLRPRLPQVDIRPLHGGMPFAAQRAALRPGARRRVVLATAIAETSLTIAGVRIVVDGGRARRARFDPASGMTRLVTERVTKAEATQRAGRAGRLEPGVCYRFWSRGEEGALAAYPPPEIRDADLSPLALDLAAWGARADELAWLDAPRPEALAQAHDLLERLGALSGGRITEHGRRMAGAPLHPRLAHMILSAPAAERGLACDLAALLEERDMIRADEVTMAWRVLALRDPQRFEQEHRATVDRAARERIAQESRRLRRWAGARGDAPVEAAGRLVALAYPDRIGMRRKGEAPRYLLSGGKGAVLPAHDRLAGAPFLAIADLDGDQREAKVRRAAALGRAEIEAVFGERLRWSDVCEWSRQETTVIARRRLMLGAMTLEDRIWKDAPEAAIAAAMADGVRRMGLGCLPWRGEALRLRDRVRWIAGREDGWPDWSDEALMAAFDQWLVPCLGLRRTRQALDDLDLHGALKGFLGWERAAALDQRAPSHWVTPSGARAPIDYGGEAPALEVRIQQMFGLDTHPAIMGGAVPLLIRFLSPAGRPVQTTADLPGFWANSYADVRRDLRGRYLKHPWPEDPLSAPPTNRAKPRKP